MKRTLLAACIVIATLGGCGAADDPNKLAESDKPLIEPVYRAAKAIRGAGITKVSESQIQQVKTKADIALDKIPQTHTAARQCTAAYAMAAIQFGMAAEMSKIGGKVENFKKGVSMWEEAERLCKDAEEFYLGKTTVAPFAKEKP